MLNSPSTDAFSGVVSLLRRRNLRETLKPILYVNLASYTLLLVLIAVSNTQSL
jgi:hypothetical protein